MTATWRTRGRGATLPDEEVSSSAADRTTDGEDLDGFFEVPVQRDNGVASGIDELGVAEDVAEHRLGALVVGVQLVKRLLESPARVANRAP